jgi:hypothetical protein
MKVTQILALSGHSIGLALPMVSPHFEIFFSLEFTEKHSLTRSALKEFLLSGVNAPKIYCTRLRSSSGWAQQS